MIYGPRLGRLIGESAAKVRIPFGAIEGDLVAVWGRPFQPLCSLFSLAKECIFVRAVKGNLEVQKGRSIYCWNALLYIYVYEETSYQGVSYFQIREYDIFRTRYYFFLNTNVTDLSNSLEMKEYSCHPRDLPLAL